MAKVQEELWGEFEFNLQNKETQLALAFVEKLDDEDDLAMALKMAKQFKNPTVATPLEEKLFK